MTIIKKISGELSSEPAEDYNKKNLKRIYHRIRNSTEFTALGIASMLENIEHYSKVDVDEMTNKEYAGYVISWLILSILFAPLVS